jgi:hypothetical protein
MVKKAKLGHKKHLSLDIGVSEDRRFKSYQGDLLKPNAESKNQSMGIKKLNFRNWTPSNGSTQMAKFNTLGGHQTKYELKNM